MADTTADETVTPNTFRGALGDRSALGESLFAAGDQRVAMDRDTWPTWPSPVLVAKPGRPTPCEEVTLAQGPFTWSAPELLPDPGSGLSLFRKSGNGLVFNLTGDHDADLVLAEGL